MTKRDAGRVATESLKTFVFLPVLSAVAVVSYCISLDVTASLVSVSMSFTGQGLERATFLPFPLFLCCVIAVHQYLSDPYAW